MIKGYYAIIPLSTPVVVRDTEYAGYGRPASCRARARSSSARRLLPGPRRTIVPPKKPRAKPLVSSRIITLLGRGNAGSREPIDFALARRDNRLRATIAACSAPGCRSIVSIHIQMVPAPAGRTFALLSCRRFSAGRGEHCSGCNWCIMASPCCVNTEVRRDCTRLSRGVIAKPG